MSSARTIIFVWTLAANQVALDADDVQSVFGKGIGEFLAAHAHAKDDDVDALIHQPLAFCMGSISSA
jgi:hypothetical protein